MAQPTAKCTQCGRMFSASFQRCPFCSAPAPPPPAPPPPRPSVVACSACKRPYSSTFSACPFCKTPVNGEPTVRPGRPDYAALAEETARRNAPFLLLDSSPASVLAQDTFFDLSWGTEGCAPKDDAWTPTPGQQAVILSHGVYFGEVLRRCCGGSWQESAEAPDNPLWSAVVVRNGMQIFAIAKVFKRLKNGSEDALEPLFLHARRSAGSVPGREEFGAWMAQGAFFERVGRPDLALHFYDRALTLDLVPEEHAAAASARKKAVDLAAQAVPAEPEEASRKEPVAGKPLDFQKEAEAGFSLLKRAGVICDFSPPSLVAIDFFLTQSWGKDPLSPDRRAGQSGLVWTVGCYLGEAFRLRLGGTWYMDPQTPSASRVTWPDGQEICPFGVLAKRMEAGAGSSIYAQFEACRARLQNREDTPPAALEAEEWLAQAEALDEALGRADIALALAQHALKLRPDWAAAYTRMGDWCARLPDRAAQAAQCYERALALDAGCAEAWRGRTSLASSQGDMSGALDWAERGLAARPGDAPLQVLQADALRASGRLAEAHDAYLRARTAEGALAGAGACAEALGDREAALAIYREAIRGKPCAALWTKVGALEEARGDVVKAVEALQAAGRFKDATPEEAARTRTRLEALERTAEWRLEEAARLAGQGDQAGALASIDRILADEPGCVEAWCERGVALVLLGRGEEALDSFDRAIGLAPSEPKAYDHKAVTLLRLQRADQALAVVEAGLVPCPTARSLLVRRGVCFVHLNRLEEAEAAFAEAYRADPEATDALVYRGDALAKLGRMEEAVSTYREFARLVPAWRSETAMKVRRFLWGCDHPGCSLDSEGAEALQERAFALLQGGDPAGALSAFERATEVDPFNAEIWMNRGASLTQADRHDEALAAYERALDLKGEIPVTLRNKAVSLQRLGREGEALGCYERILAGNPNDGATLRAKAKLLLALGRAGEELACYERLLAGDPREAGVLGLAADCLRRLKRPEEALAACDRALVADPENRRLLLLKALALTDLDRVEEALALEERAMSAQGATGSGAPTT